MFSGSWKYQKISSGVVVISVSVSYWFFRLWTTYKVEKIQNDPNVFNTSSSSGSRLCLQVIFEGNNNFPVIFFSCVFSMFVWCNLMKAWWNINFGKILCPPREATPIVLFCNEQIGMCHWMGLQFHDWIDYKGVAFSIVSPEWGQTFWGFWG